MQGIVTFQLRSLADLLQRTYAAVDLAQIARAVMLHVRDSLPPEARRPAELNALERRLVAALDDLYLVNLLPEKTEVAPELTDRISTAESGFDTQIEAAARLLDRQELVSANGSVLRAAAPAIAEAAQEIVRRRSNEFALDIARDQETLGAPPSILFKLDGQVVWSNHALNEWVERRGLNQPKVLQAACRFAGPVCAALRRREDVKRSQLKKHMTDSGVHFLGVIKRRGQSAGETLLLVEVTEAKRATDLSPRELQVARLVAQHGSYSTAAEVAEVSLDSVRTYVRRIYRKFGVSTRTQLKARLIREGLLDRD